MRTLAELIRWRARRHPDLEAIWYAGTSQTYGELNESTSRLAGALASQLGIQPGDRVAILDKNCGAYLELVLALDKAGAVAAPVNWRLTANEVKLIIEDIKPKLIVSGPEFRANGAAAGIATMTFDELPRGGEDPNRDQDGAISTQFCTSGTTGLPKGAMLTGWNMLNTGVCLALEMPELREGCRSLVAMPMFHLGGTGWPIWSMQQGASLVIVREVAPESLLKTIVEQRVETALLVPAVMLFLCELPQSRTADFSALKHITYGTAPISPEVLRRSIDTFKCRFSQIYGLTETTGPFTSLAHQHHVAEKLASCGRPMFGARAKVVDASGRELPPYEVGELMYQGESLMSGYWARKKETDDVIREGWLRTGEAGYVDKDGFFFIKDRIKDMIVTGSENVYPAEIEAVLASHPDIVEVAVIGVPDARWGESVKACVVKRLGSTVTAEMLIHWCRDKLAGYKRPRTVDFIDALPRNASGKMLKRKLREPYWASHERKVN
jgi:acyl-CoA synthetase (AMP-forming)/AMP-acid ligase II